MDRQRLADRFRDQVGLTPKVTARVLRLEQAARLLVQHPASEVAVAGGYADQAHLSREVQALAGCTPGGLNATICPRRRGRPAPTVTLISAPGHPSASMSSRPCPP